MIDNFELIEPLLEFPNEDIYYHLQIIQRKKDCPEIGSNNRVIKSYFICKRESLEKTRQEIINLCKLFNARAYINLTPKSLRKTTLLQLKYLSERLYMNDLKKIWKSWNSCAGEVKGEEPRWVVDLDDISDITMVENIKYQLTLLEPVGEKIKAIIPTKSGFHLISTPFNVQKFKDSIIGKTIDVHKNNPTLLYCI